MRDDDHPMQLLLLTVCGRANRPQQGVVACLVSDNREVGGGEAVRNEALGGILKHDRRAA